MKRDPDIDPKSNNSDPKKYKFGEIYNCEGPYEEFGEDSSDSDMSSESESDEEDLQSLPKQLLGGCKFVLFFIIDNFIINLYFFYFKNLQNHPIVI